MAQSPQRNTVSLLQSRNTMRSFDRRATMGGGATPWVCCWRRSGQRWLRRLLRSSEASQLCQLYGTRHTTKSCSWAMLAVLIWCLYACMWTAFGLCTDAWPSFELQLGKEVWLMCQATGLWVAFAKGCLQGGQKVETLRPLSC